MTNASLLQQWLNFRVSLCVLAQNSILLAKEYPHLLLIVIFITYLKTNQTFEMMCSIQINNNSITKFCCCCNWDFVLSLAELQRFPLVKLWSKLIHKRRQIINLAMNKTVAKERQNNMKNNHCLKFCLTRKF